MLRVSGGCSSVRSRNSMLTGIPPSPSIYWNHDVSGQLRNNLFESTACGQNSENKIFMTSLSEQSGRFRLNNHQLSKLWMARSDVTASEWLASRKRGEKWKCLARLVAALVGKGSFDSSNRFALRIGWLRSG